MQTAREDKIREIFEEVARGSNLDQALALIADHVAASLGAPTCKIWVVKRGDICETCPLASNCSNRQMCMHLIAASGAVMEKEYPRVPLSLFSASEIGRGGTADFSEADGIGETLFGLQHDSQQGDGHDSYAIYPLKGLSGTVGLIGIFNHRTITDLELRLLPQFAPAAVAAIRVAELQSRADLFRQRLEKETAQASTLKQSAAARENELEDAVAQLTVQIAQLQAEREPTVRASEEATLRAERAEAEKLALEESLERINEDNRQMKERTESMLQVQQESGRAYSEMAAQLESERRRIEEENAWLKGRLATREQSVAEQTGQREKLAAEVAERNREVRSLKTALEATHSEILASRQAIPRMQERLDQYEETGKALRDHNAALSESVDDLKGSLRVAEDARGRLEQVRVFLEQQTEESSEENSRLWLENDRINGENEQLVTEVERLRAEVNETRELLTDLSNRLSAAETRVSEDTRSAEERDRQLEDERVSLAEDRLVVEALLQQLDQDNTTLARERDTVGRHALQLEEQSATLGKELDALKEYSHLLEEDNSALTQANSQLGGAVSQLQQLTARLEDSVARLKDRAEADDRVRSELEQQTRTMAEQNRRLSQESLTQARFIANMSHELRTPMNAIIGFTSLLLEDRSLKMTARPRRSLERVARNARNLLELINNVLDLSKIDAGRMDVYSEPAEARDLIERAMGVVEPLKEDRPVELVIDVEDDLPTIRTDRGKLQQILINLLSNAIKFTHEGEVKVTAERAPGDRIRIAVSDTGIGLSVSDFPKLFQEFQQFGSHDEIKSGTGLGLAITRRLVNLLGGEITASSKPGEGATFALTIPLEIEGSAAATEEASEMAADPERTALLVDGDPGSLYLVKKYLTEAGYSVAATDDPERGIEIGRMAKPAMVAIDLDLLEGGINVIEQIARDHPNGTIVAMSSSANTEQEARGAGANIFLLKPIDRGEMLRILERSPSLPPAGRILVVEDNPDTLDLVVAMIEGQGYEIQTATNGRQALDEVARLRPDAIILDLMLPDIDGFEVVHRLNVNPEWHDIPVILLTARDLTHEERRALDSAARIIQKGNYTRDELLAELKLVTAGQASSVKNE